MTQFELRYVQRMTDRHGKLRHYYRRPGHQRVTLPGEPGSPEFMAAYRAAAAGETALKLQVGASRTKPGSFAALIVAYYGSAEHQALRPTTRPAYRAVIEGLREEIGDDDVRHLEARHVRALMDRKAGRPAAANNRLRMLRVLMRFAVERGWRRDDPTVGVKPIRHRSDGFATWTEEQIATFEARWPLGSRELLAFRLLLYSGQRRQDVVTLGRQHVRAGAFRLRQEKGGARLTLQIHPRLQEALDLAPAGQLTFLVTDKGAPFTPKRLRQLVSHGRPCGRPAGRISPRPAQGAAAPRRRGGRLRAPPEGVERPQKPVGSRHLHRRRRPGETRPRQPRPDRTANTRLSNPPKRFDNPPRNPPSQQRSAGARGESSGTRTQDPLIKSQML